MFRANDGDFCSVIYVVHFGIIILFPMYLTRIIDEVFGAQLYAIAAPRATLSNNMVFWSLQKFTMFRANDSDFGCAIYILHLRIVIFVTMYFSGFFNKLNNIFTARFLIFFFTTLRAFMSVYMI